VIFNYTPLHHPVAEPGFLRARAKMTFTMRAVEQRLSGEKPGQDRHTAVGHVRAHDVGLTSSPHSAVAADLPGA
jgi:hypothetical protein